MKSGRSSKKPGIVLIMLKIMKAGRQTRRVMLCPLRKDLGAASMINWKQTVSEAEFRNIYLTTPWLVALR